MENADTKMVWKIQETDSQQKSARPQFKDSIGMG